MITALATAPTIATAAYLMLLEDLLFSLQIHFLVLRISSTCRIPWVIGHTNQILLAQVLDILFILHAEHEMDCSTVAARYLASSGVDVYTYHFWSGGALYCSLYCGANKAVLKILSDIGSADNIPEFIEGVKNRTATKTI